MNPLTIVVYLCLVLAFGEDASARKIRRRRNPPSDGKQLDWNSIVPKPNLNYRPCFDGKYCARLEVPLNYNASNASGEQQKVALGLIRIPAKVPVTDPRYGGAMYVEYLSLPKRVDEDWNFQSSDKGHSLINPGGPGGSGVATARGYGQNLQALVDAAYVNGSTTYVSNSSSALYFDIIGWDPRAVQRTTPFFSCQQSGTQQIVQYLQGQTPLLGTPEGDFDVLWSQYSSLNMNCAYDPETNPGGSMIERFASTTITARDMVSIIEAHGRWREEQARTPAQRHRLRYQPGEEPLQYAGGSYGTDLGQVFASMQPHRIKRMFLDGVDDTEDDISGTLHQGLWEADQIMDKCFEYCSMAGPEKCALWAPTAHGVRARVFDILGDIEQNGPIPVGRSGMVDANVVTLSDIFENAYEMLYDPLESLRPFAEAMAPLSQRNGTAFVQQYKLGANPIFESATFMPPNVRVNSSVPASDTHPWASSAQISNAIACPEAWVRRNKTEFRSFLKFCQGQSFWGAPAFATEYLTCTDTFKVNTAWNFLLDHPIGSNVTAHPILLGSNHLDPICPLTSAEITQSRFKGSFLLVNEGEGHEALSNPSLEFGQLLRRYFQTGELPPQNQPRTLPLARPLLGSNGPRTAPLSKNASLEDRMLAKALADQGI